MTDYDSRLMAVSLEKANETQLDIMSAAMAFASENAEAVCGSAGYPGSAAESAGRFLKEISGCLANARDMLRGLPKGNYDAIAQRVFCSELTGGGSLEDSRES